MDKHKIALELLCDEIIKYASPSRGEPPPAIIVDRRDDHRPTYLPIFFDEVVLLKHKLTKKYGLPEDQTRKSLVDLIQKILLEGEKSFPLAPPYWDMAINICVYFAFPEVDTWFSRQLLSSARRWNSIDSRKFMRIVSAITLNLAHS
jgi:hypothetical protein